MWALAAVVVLMILAAAIAAWIASHRGASAAPSSDPGAESPQIVEVDDAPIAGDLARPWGATSSEEVVYVSQHWRAVEGILALASGFTEGRHVQVVGAAALVPEPEHRSPDSVAVWVRGERVGYLPLDVARRHVDGLRSLAADGRHLAVAVRLGGRRRGGREVAKRVFVWMPEPDGYEPLNDLPDQPHAVLSAGASIRVLRPEPHAALLEPLAIKGVDVPLAATLHSGNVIEVRLDGERIGELSALQSARLADAVASIEADGKIVVARARLRHKGGLPDVTLSAAPRIEHS